MDTTRINEIVANCTCGHHQPLTIAPIVISDNALQQVVPYLEEQNVQSVLLVADQNTYYSAGKVLSTYITNTDITYSQVIVSPNQYGDVPADEQSIVQVMLGTSSEQTDMLIAVGSGTIHDIVRFVAYKMNKSFISIPTAASVDGFTSAGAPILIRGEKKTFPAKAPKALFADLQILMDAPFELSAAGFGDILGKYTSLVDWKFSQLYAHEPYCQAAAQITREALERCVLLVDEIAQRSEKGIYTLMRGLIESGLAMLLFGHSHPASGGEHHLSHYWEMDYLKRGERQLLHGAKVGVATVEISRLYHQILKDKVLFHHFNNDLQDQETIQDAIGSIPTPKQLQLLLRTVKGPASISELGLKQELLKRSLQQAYLIRVRFTLLKAFATNQT